MVDRYLNFDLLITSAEGGYRAQVIESPVGEATTRFTLPAALAPPPDQGQPQPGATRGFVRPTDPNASDAQAIGAPLFAAVFAGDVGVCLTRSEDAAGRQGKGLRIRVRLTQTPELVDVPWESLFDARQNTFLALSETTPVVRYLDLAEPVEALDAP